ncbi:MAG: NADH-quinone oxidoreductase subunit L [Dehalococcoidia bacterium]|nr:NADH-quinone oxidoreductase subunit L [Dehalococcoidia bacterium]
MIELITLLILFIPFSVFLINSLLLRTILGSENDLSGRLNVISIGVCFFLSLIVIFNLNNASSTIVFDWINIGDVDLSFSFMIDPLTSVMLVVVSGISFLVQIYSIGYMHGDKSFSRYFSFMALFTGSMLGLVMSRNILQLFIFWELVGVSSYLLIGFWHERKAAAAAAKKAFIMTRLGDFGFLFSIIYLFNINPDLLNIHLLYDAIVNNEISTQVATVLSLGFLIGAIGKSAQFPLHSWLPDAMEGPTSVSALIHSATMVTAGVFLIARLFPLFQISDIMILVAIIGASTSFIAATMALTTTDIKRVLAYSTISQLGYMFMGLGLEAYTAAVFHLFTHAFFKAGLFLSAGSVHHASGTFNMKYMGGLKSKMKYTYYSMLICSFSLSGLFPLSGFWSKDEIILSAYNQGGSLGLICMIIGLLVAFMTSFYMFRAISLTFHGDFRGGGDKEREDLIKQKLPVPETLEHVHLEESPKYMIYPILLLSFFAIFIGYFANPVFSDLLFIDKHLFGLFLEKSLEVFHFHGSHDFNFSIALVSTFISIVGILFGLSIYNKKTELDKGNFFTSINNFLDKKYFIDYLYEKFIVQNIFYELICAGLEWIDKNIFDGININLSKLIGRISLRSLKFQDGQIHTYSIAMVTAGVISIFILIILG